MASSLPLQFILYIAARVIYIQIDQVAVKNCFIFKETSDAQSPVIVFLDVKQPDRVGSRGFALREGTGKKGRKTESGRRHLGRLRGRADLGSFGASYLTSVSLLTRL